MTESETAAISGLFKLLADSNRLRVLDAISCGPINVSQLCNALNLNQPVISQGLALLRVSGLVDCQREGKHNFYSLTRLGKFLVSTFTELHKRVS